MHESLLDVAAEIKFEAFRHLLLSKKWQESPSKYGNISIFSKIDGDDDLKIRIPKICKDINVYSSAMADAVRLYSFIDESDPFGVAISLQKEQIDLHRIHLPVCASDKNAASLLIVANATQAFLKLFYESMLEEASEEPKSKASSFKESCRFGHTFPGSFGVSFEAPINMKSLPLFENAEIELTEERKASNRISTGINELAQSAGANEYQRFKDSMESGLTPSMCRTLLSLSPIIYKGMKYETIWSPFMPQDTINVCLDKKSIPFLEREASPEEKVASIEPIEEKS